jgi:hypothetical protein
MLADVIISNKFLLRKINGLKLFFFYSDKRYLISKYIFETRPSLTIKKIVIL